MFGHVNRLMVGFAFGKPNFDAPKHAFDASILPVNEVKLMTGAGHQEN